MRSALSDVAPVLSGHAVRRQLLSPSDEQGRLQGVRACPGVSATQAAQGVGARAWSHTVPVSRDRAGGARLVETKWPVLSDRLEEDPPAMTRHERDTRDSRTFGA